MAITLTFLIPLLLAWWSHRGNTDLRSRIVGFGFATLLLGVMIGLFLLLDRGPQARWQDMMPLHICDLAVFACAFACITRKQFLFEIAYFWGLAGTIHGLITPDLDYGYPTLQFWFFFLGHGGIIGSIIFMLAGLRLRPKNKSVLRAYIAILVYGAIASVFNLLFQTNYGYVCEKPVSGSLFDLLGPWPWYILSAAIVGFISFWILYAPWAYVDTRKPKT